MSKEYIEKALLMQRIENESRLWGDEYDVSQVLGDIEDFPPADVKPVVRCKDCVSYREENALRYCILYDFTVRRDFYCADFCPNCGAEMKGEEDETPR